MSPELLEFLTGLASDPHRATRYSANPAAEMAAANLSETDREILRKTGPSHLGDLVHGLEIFCVPPDPSNPPPPPPPADAS